MVYKWLKGWTLGRGLCVLNFVKYTRPPTSGNYHWHMKNNAAISVTQGSLTIWLYLEGVWGARAFSFILKFTPIKIKLRHKAQRGKTSSHWSHQRHFHATSFGQGSYQSLEFLRKSWNLPSNFLDLEKVSKMEITSGKMAKGLHSFCFGQILFKLAHMFPAHHEKSFAVVFLRCLLITYLITLSLEKKIIVLEKDWKKSWICKNPVWQRHRCIFVFI